MRALPCAAAGANPTCPRPLSEVDGALGRQPSPEPLPPLVAAALAHLPELERCYRDRLALRVDVARSYATTHGATVVTLRLRCDPESETLRRDEDYATLEARDLLQHLGFIVRVDGRCLVRLVGYYGSQIPAVAA
jgi:hypothetical protein